MFAIAGYARVSTEGTPNTNIVNDSVRVELTSTHKSTPADIDYEQLGIKLVSRLPGMLQCQLVISTDDDKRIALNIDSDFRKAVCNHKRGFSRVYKFSKTAVRVTYRMRASEVH